ncbi:alpha/beta fold hydrolase [Falsiruegeria mediterranea]|jgi:class 3 adenylate cyclase/pimeloyl-ACP methyl ester carboxylesterase|uniref:Non-heme chloroperoxidase CPO-A1 n=1 Tax=Falsiruegeria mediterranea M17 TaxID=1200281 RepID=A0A2R8C460_9RHOB|nr:alpha/beta fold hydrolase [Falsiruegeria mediterranea]SPJ27210.1 Non-heme chloroperoxidase CPO-A1 [Falsiruegeria mediterranea M17]
MADMAGYSRLIEADEDGVLARQRSYRKTLIDPTIAEAHGRIVKTTGDGMMVEFTSPRAAVTCALAIQSGMIKHEENEPHDTRIQYRIGINIGDVVDEDGDLFGDDINVAARLEQMAEPGGVCLSDALHQLVHSHLDVAFADLGSQSVKNISRPIRVWQWTPIERERYSDARELSRSQQIEFCVAPDGVQLAYARVGTGSPVLKMPNWLNHLEYDWYDPIRGPMLQDMARAHQFIRFDQRGNGLSDWEAEDISEDAMATDIETVVKAAGLERFAVFAVSQGCAFAVRYAATHPERVRCMVMYGGYARGSLRRGKPDQEALHAATTDVIRAGWGSVTPAFRHMFTEMMMPTASAAQKESFDELQRVASSPENAARVNDMNARCDVSDLARQIKVPVLVLHAEGDKRVPVEEGRRLAALIPGARFQTLPGDNHMLLPGTPAYDSFSRSFREFMAEHHD